MLMRPGGSRTDLACRAAIVLVTGGLSACDAPKDAAPSTVKNATSVTAPSGSSAAQGVAIVADFLQRRGEDIKACFAGAPDIVGPGATQPGPGRARPAVVINRLVVAIDASGSMAAKTGSTTKMDAAKRAATAFLGGVPSKTEVGLIAFGHRGNNRPDGKAESCRGVETIYPLGTADAAEVGRALQAVRATGWTPLAAAITKAGGAFVPSDTPGAQVVYVVSDGIETCGGDPVAAARALNAGPVKAIVNIIGFDLDAADRAQLQAVAAAGGGTFVEAHSESDVSRMLDETRRKAQAASAMTTEYFDAGARSTANNFAVGKYTTKVNFCIAHATSAESAGLLKQLDSGSTPGPVREAAMAVLRTRHEGYRDEAAKISHDLLARSTTANDAIAAQQRASEIRLGVRP